MITNLKLGSTSTATALTPTDTNITNVWTLPQVNAGGAPSIGEIYDSPIVDALVDTPGQYSLQTDITANDFYGYYYNWCAATAGGTASGGVNTCTNASTMPVGDATGDVCPAKWRLPSGTTTGDYAILNASMIAGVPSAPSTTNQPSNWNWSGKFSGILAGSRNANTFDSMGVATLLSTSSRATADARSNTNQYITASWVSSGDGYNYRSDRNPLRCVAR
ncbi:MAG: fibrobacter succinogenes major paralogous domain-containing protein [Oscillospiraceae bacterium]|nr:fibrobacter succinogenes major paralogous domain-containing protein [Oscillospiraceae bacterium]